MNRPLVALCIGSLALGCASSPRSEPISTTQVTSADLHPRLDPLGVDPAVEASLIPRVDVPSARSLRHNTPRDVARAMDVLKTANSVDGATKRLTERLGRPSWTETFASAPNAKRRIWVAASGKQCQRLVLESDGTVTLDVASRSEWRTLSASARQSPCTGEIQHGLTR